jgi:hypothetical protein
MNQVIVNGKLQVGKASMKSPDALFQTLAIGCFPWDGTVVAKVGSDDLVRYGQIACVPKMHVAADDGLVLLD